MNKTQETFRCNSAKRSLLVLDTLQFTIYKYELMSWALARLYYISMLNVTKLKIENIIGNRVSITTEVYTSYSTTEYLRKEY